ncbi:MAG: hypothetical protein Q7U70_05200 [Methylotenera sp.]|nr:hypothetical protein [Methylotenera sp.]MDO9389157.1 hypothetical protein [Methylotenera sp.]
MAFSKEDMQSELLEFMKGFAAGVERLYGVHEAAILSNPLLISNSTLWNALGNMYDYGVLGIPVIGLGDDPLIDGMYADAEVFLNCIATNAMEPYLYEDNVGYPNLSIKTARMAVARVVLEGGERYTDYGAGEYGLGNGDWGYLTLSEIALLADMDERSVRNAANPKVNDPLITETVGKRSLVTPQEAKRWLAGRKGFTPTQLGRDIKKQVATKTIDLPSDIAEQLSIKAEQAGLSVAEFIKTVI